VPTDYTYNTERYWATLPARELAPLVLQRFRDWRRYCRDAGHTKKALGGLLYYHGWNRIRDRASELGLKSGTYDYIHMVVNEVRQGVQRVLAMLASRTPRMEPVAASTSAGAREETIMAREVLQHVARLHQTASLHAEVRKLAFLMGEAYRLCLWNGAKGKPLAATAPSEPGAAPVPVVHEGDFENSVCSILDVARDPTVRTWDKVPWVVVRTYENKHELAARYPELATRIRGLSFKGAASDDEFLEDVLDVVARNSSTFNGDTIPVYNFYHVAGNAVQGGLAFTCLSDSIWLGEPTSNPYANAEQPPHAHLPVKRLAPDTMWGTTLGDTNVFDTLGLSDATNILWSTQVTNLTRWGIGILGVAKGAGLSKDTLGNGASYLEYAPVAGAPNGGMPTPLEPPTAPQEMAKVLEAFRGLLAQGLGLNDVAMGQLPFAGMPAALVAQLIEQAHQYQDAFYNAIVRFESDCATHELNCLKRFAQNSRTYETPTDSKGWAQREFTGEDLNAVSRVAFEPVPPIANSLAGKQMQLETMMQMAQAQGPLTFPDIVEFYATGALPPSLKEIQNNNLRIAEMQEQLRNARYLQGPNGPQPILDPITGAPMLNGLGEPRMQLDPTSVPLIMVGMPVWTYIQPLMALFHEKLPMPAFEATLATVERCMQVWMATPPPILAVLGAPPAPGTPLAPPPMPGVPPGSPQEGGGGAPPTAAPAAPPPPGSASPEAAGVMPPPTNPTPATPEMLTNG
jgi:hypothetical protein